MIHHFFLDHSALKRKTNRNVPNLFDLLHRGRSVLVAALQWFSTLLGDENGRARLVWQVSGFTGIASFIEDEPGMALVFRRSILSAAGGLRRRLHDYVRSWPWKVFGTADVRRPLADRRRDGCHAECRARQTVLSWLGVRA